VLVLLPLLSLGTFHAARSGLGLLMAARGVGALIGPFIGRAWPGRRTAGCSARSGAALATFGFGYALPRARARR
jgi:hypothetical protein